MHRKEFAPSMLAHVYMCTSVCVIERSSQHRLSGNEEADVEGERNTCFGQSTCLFSRR